MTKQISNRCFHCGKNNLDLEDYDVGDTIMCTRCGQEFQIGPDGNGLEVEKPMLSDFVQERMLSAKGELREMKKGDFDMNSYGAGYTTGYAHAMTEIFEFLENGGDQ